MVEDSFLLDEDYWVELVFQLVDREDSALEAGEGESEEAEEKLRVVEEIYEVLRFAYLFKGFE